MTRFFLTWFTFWEGALIAHFFGLGWALVWCAAWSVLALGVRLGKSAK